MIHPTNNKSLSQKIIWHLMVVVGAIFITLFFSLILIGKIWHSQLLSMFILTVIQLEIFIWMGTLFFASMKIGTAGFKKKMILRLLLFYFSVLLIAAIFFIGVFYINYAHNNYGFKNFYEALTHLEIKGFGTSTLMGFTLGTLFFFYVQWSEALKREQKLTKEKLIFQYETLKNQVNPHFLFNSLNTLSSLVRTDVDLSEQFIHKLSSVYRYVLENMENELVPVSAELKFVADFFYLQKIRDQEKIELNIETNNHEEGMIPPVSIQMLVENALKHNASTRSNPLTVTIHYEGLDKLVVRNNRQKKTQLNHSSKIGLKNLNERCRLILNNELEILENSEEFVVKIPVKINLK